MNKNIQQIYDEFGDTPPTNSNGLSLQQEIGGDTRAYKVYDWFLDKFNETFPSVFDDAFSNAFGPAFDALFPAAFDALFPAAFDALFPAAFDALFPAAFSAGFDLETADWGSDSIDNYLQQSLDSLFADLYPTYSFSALGDWVDDLLDAWGVSDLPDATRLAFPGSLDWVAFSTLTGPPTLTFDNANAPYYVATVSHDLTAKIFPGSRIKLTQTTEKFFVVSEIDATTITLFSTQYALANAAITVPGYTHERNIFENFDIEKETVRKFVFEIFGNSAVTDPDPSDNLLIATGSGQDTQTVALANLLKSQLGIYNAKFTVSTPTLSIAPSVGSFFAVSMRNPITPGDVYPFKSGSLSLALTTSTASNSVVAGLSSTAYASNPTVELFAYLLLENVSGTVTPYLMLSRVPCHVACPADYWHTNSATTRTKVGNADTVEAAAWIGKSGAVTVANTTAICLGPIATAVFDRTTGFASSITLLTAAQPLYDCRVSGWQTGPMNVTGYSAAMTFTFKYKLHDRLCFVLMDNVAVGTSNATGNSIYLPIVSSQAVSASGVSFAAVGVNGGSGVMAWARIGLTSGSNNARILDFATADGNPGGWANSGSKYGIFNGSFAI